MWNLMPAYHVMWKYSKDMVIESKTLLQMGRQIIIPAVFKYRRDLSAGVAVLMSCFLMETAVPRKEVDFIN